MTPSVLAIGGSFILSLFCILAPLLIRFPERHQATIFSISGGAGLTYVFLYLLFELVKDGAPEIHAAFPVGPGALETIFILLLLAVSATYITLMILEKTPHPQDDHRAFAILFIVYNFLAGVGLLEEAPWGFVNLALYTMAIGFHVLFNELYLLHHYAECHTRPWRIALQTAPLLGCLLAILLRVPPALLYGSLTMVAGVTIINTIKHETPGSGGFRPLAFLSGIIVYGALILSAWRF